MAWQKVELDGMKLAAREPIKSRGGRDGTFFHLEAGEGQGKTAYLVALFVTPAKIYTVKATGPAEGMAADVDALKRAMASLT